MPFLVSAATNLHGQPSGIRSHIKIHIYDGIPLFLLLSDYLANDWGIGLGKDMVVDTALQQLSIAVANQYANHAITQKMQGLAALFPSARSVSITGKKDGINQTQLVLTSAQAWGETDLQGLENNGQISVRQRVDRVAGDP